MCSSGIASGFIQGGAHKGCWCYKPCQQLVELSCLRRQWLMPATAHKLSKQGQQLQIFQQHHSKSLRHPHHTTCRGRKGGMDGSQQSTA